MNITQINQMLSNHSRIVWACRRGMLELDVILNRFFKEAYEALHYEDKVRFIALLDCNDMELYAWLIRGVESPIDNEHAIIVNKIRKHVRCRIQT